MKAKLDSKGDLSITGIKLKEKLVTGGEGRNTWERLEMANTAGFDPEKLRRKYVPIDGTDLSFCLVVRKDIAKAGAKVAAKKVKTVAIKDAEYAEFKAFQAFKASQA